MFAMQPGDTGITVAVGSALAMGLPLLALVVTGHPVAAVFAAFGAFTGLYGDDRPYRVRARLLAGVGAGFVGAVALGSAGGLLLPHGWWVLAVAVAAAVAKWGCDTAGVGTPGAWMFLFAFAASTQVPTRPEDIVVRALLAAAGAAVAVTVTMLGALGDPGGPERRAVAAALRTTAQVLRLGADATPRDWHVAHVALRRAERCARAAAPAARPPLLALLHRAEGLLTDAVLAPDDPRVAAQSDLLLQDRAPLRRPPARWPRRRRPGRTVEAAGPDPTDARFSPPPEVRVAREQQARHVAVLRLFTAARVFLGAGVAGAGALALGLGHPYWAPVSAAAVLQATHVRMTWHRSIQRGLGTAAGLLLGALLLAAHPDPVLIAVLVVLMQVGIEAFIRRNYALGVLFITPMTMLLSDLLVPSSTYDLVVDRLGGVALGHRRGAGGRPGGVAPPGGRDAAPRGRPLRAGDDLGPVGSPRPAGHRDGGAPGRPGRPAGSRGRGAGRGLAGRRPPGCRRRDRGTRVPGPGHVPPGGPFRGVLDGHVGEPPTQGSAPHSR